MNEVLNIAICEDTKEEVEKLLSVLNQSSIKNQCTVFQNAQELLDVYVPQKFDLLLMDIYMEGMSGIEAVAKIRKYDEDVPVAFITTSKDFALESYRLSALKYIEKPYKRKPIEDILKLALLEKENAPCLVVHWSGKEQHIRISQIIYLEAQSRLLLINLKNGEVISVYNKLSSVLPQLEDYPFFSPHKSYCVNLACVQYIDKELRCFVMSNGTNIPIRRESMGKAKKALEDFLFQRAGHESDDEN